MKILVLVSCLLFSPLSSAYFCGQNELNTSITNVCIYGYGNSVTGYNTDHGVRLDLSVGTSDLSYKFDTSVGEITLLDNVSGDAKVVATDDGHGNPITIVFHEQVILGKTYPREFSIMEGDQLIFRSKKVEFEDATMAVDSIIASIQRDKGSR